MQPRRTSFRGHHWRAQSPHWLGLIAVFWAVGAGALAQRQADCIRCHVPEAAQFQASIHATVVRCPQCHGGRDVYELSSQDAVRFAIDGMPPPAGTTRPVAFDHGESFRGKPARTAMPELCGNCHADVERMNPFGLRTDQLAAYRLSGHGKRLFQFGDDRVAVCIDCHGVHDILPHDNAHSRTHFSNVPATCGRCHADPQLMGAYNLPADIVDQYRQSVHGQNLLEHGDAGSPNCATCHGSHAAAPPGFSEVGHVCGKCHMQVEEYVASSVHGRISVLARCTGCHGKNGFPRNHQIGRATPAAESLVQTYETLRVEGVAGEPLRAAFIAKVQAMPNSLRPDSVCRYCHGAARTDPHAAFFETSDREVLELGSEFTAGLRDAQFEYARAAGRVAELSHGVLLVRDQGVRVEDAKTEVTALYAFLHTFNRGEIQQRVQKVREICAEVGQELDRKEAGLNWRRWALYPVWAFIAIFFAFMYSKYLALKHAYVRSPGEPVAVARELAIPARRRFLDMTLRVMGVGAVASLLWPAVAYVLPARKRGGGSERVTAGKESDWSVWDVRKVVVAGKPAGVVRTDKGFRAFSLVCTHLGCIVHWESTSHEFRCPCHAAVFDAAGQVVSGPPPKPLPEYGVSVLQGDVIVQGTQAG